MGMVRPCQPIDSERYMSAFLWQETASPYFPASNSLFFYFVDEYVWGLFIASTDLGMGTGRELWLQCQHVEEHSHAPWPAAIPPLCSGGLEWLSRLLAVHATCSVVSDSSRPRDWTQAFASPALAGGFFTLVPPRKAPSSCYTVVKMDLPFNYLFYFFFFSI